MLPALRPRQEKTLVESAFINIARGNSGLELVPIIHEKAKNLRDGPEMQRLWELHVPEGLRHREEKERGQYPCVTIQSRWQDSHVLISYLRRTRDEGDGGVLLVLIGRTTRTTSTRTFWSDIEDSALVPTLYIVDLDSL